MCKTRRPIMSVILLYILMMFCNMSITVATTTEPQEFPKEFDFRYTSYQELQENFNIFQHEDIVGYYIQLTVDIDRNQLLVGARGVLYRLSLDNLTSIEITEWQADPNTKRMCRSKGQTEDDCHNFVRVLLVHQDSVFTCGTNAFSPTCTWRSPENLTEIRDTTPGVAYCPYSPDHNSTAIMTSDGTFFSGTVIDITGRDPAIYRLLGNLPMLRTVKLNSKWLNEPDFVSAYEIDDFVYFFFREVAVEYINCGKRIFSRVARVCKNDRGGNFVLEDNWTTFFKARMNCSLPGEFPFYFDELQSTFLLDTPTEKLLYAIFTTPVNSLEGSAVCVYNMTSLYSTFTGPYKYQENARAAWERHDNTEPIVECPMTDSKNKRELDETEMKKQAQQTLNAQKYQLMDLAVQPENINPTVVGKNERWTHVVADYVEGKRGIIYKVIFIATAEGRIRKMVQLPGSQTTCLIEEIDLVPNGEHRPVKQLQISKEKGALYISTLNTVIQVPVHRCNRFTDSDLCLNSMDPYCGWNQNTGECTAAPEGMPSLHYWSQDMSLCPQVEHPVDGGWSEWTEWLPCQQTGSDPSAGQCLCHTRSCDNPKPLYGGAECRGPNIEVTNCTAHGQWTEWTQWSSCSSSCGHNGTRTRQRYCSNPPPRFGGMSCVGSSREEGYCPGNPSCPEPPVNGNWAPWSDWGRCTAECNGGIQTRRRQCNNPPPSQEGVPCIGNRQEWRMCNTQICQERHRMTPWSPWVKTNATEDGYFEQRYRFMCRANVPEQTMIKSSHVKSHVRFCFKRDHSCHRPDLAYNITEHGNWSKWTSWSECSEDCDSGVQWRQRSCDNPPPAGLGGSCSGHNVEAKECNTHSCQGEWSCWTEYSACSVTCGSGTRVRLRRCTSSIPGSKFKIPCSGPSEEEIMCFTSPCNATQGWDDWSQWSNCGIDGIKYRHRTCHVTSPSRDECQGHTVEYKSCIKSDYDIKVQSVRSPPENERTFSLIHLIIVGSSAFFFGILCSVGIYLCIQSFRNFQELDLERERRKNSRSERKRKTGSFASQLSLDFLSVNNKVYDASTLAKERNTILRENSTLQTQMRTNLKNNEV